MLHRLAVALVIVAVCGFAAFIVTMALSGTWVALAALGLVAFSVGVGWALAYLSNESMG
jgi:hypothetical protein